MPPVLAPELLGRVAVPLMMSARDDRDRRGLNERRTAPVTAGMALMVLGLVAACNSSSSGARTDGGAASGGYSGGTGGDPGSGGAEPTGGHQGATGGVPGSGGSGTGGRGGGAGTGSGGGGGLDGAGGYPGTGGHDISPVPCGSTMCPLTFVCCDACDGARTCSPTCTPPTCPDGGAGGGGGMSAVDAGQTDAQSDAAGSLPCGTMTCGPQEACVTPPGPGTCLMPDGGQCPVGTSLTGGCCLPRLDPSCVAIDRPCNASAVTCACFSKDPCGSSLCAAATIQGRNVMCHGA